MPPKDYRIPSNDHMPDKEKKKQKQCTYETEEELIEAHKLRKYVEENHDNIFYTDLNQLHMKYEFIRDPLDKNNEKLNI